LLGKGARKLWYTSLTPNYHLKLKDTVIRAEANVTTSAESKVLAKELNKLFKGGIFLKYIVYPSISGGNYCFCDRFGEDLDDAIRRGNCQQVCVNVCAGVVGGPGVVGGQGIPPAPGWFGFRFGSCGSQCSNHCGSQCVENV
jgi:hypothetical protein